MTKIEKVFLPFNDKDNDASAHRGNPNIWVEAETMPIDSENNAPVTAVEPGDIVSQYIYLETLDAYLRVFDKQILKPTALNRVHKLAYPGNQHIPAATTAFDAAPNKRVASGKG